MSPRWIPSIRTTLLLNQVPLWIFAVGIVVVTGLVLGEITAESALLQGKLTTGTLTAMEIDALARSVRVAWLVSLLGFLVFTCAGTLVALRNHRALAARLQDIVEFVRAGERGGTVGDFEARGDDEIGQVESAVLEVSELARSRSQALENELVRQRFSAQLQAALELTDTEREVYELARRAFALAAPGRKVEMLLADNSEAHLRAAATTGPPGRGCPVESPSACAAVRRGQTMVFPDSEALDACPKLRRHDAGGIGALCTPVGVMGRTIGVIHVTGETGWHAGEDEIGKVEALATYIGGRLGMVRTLDSSRLQASTDPLTGLLNRRAFEAEATTVLGRRGPHAVVLFDLDHFKALNDKHGHAAGDRALKVFCEALQDAVRDRDLVGRRGGEEFVALLPDCDSAAAAVVLERVRGTLAAALERLGLPRFTVSCGVAMTPRDGDELEHLLAACDLALYAAKEGGRDAVVFHAAGNEAPSAGGGCDADDREDEEAGVPHHSFSA